MANGFKTGKLVDTEAEVIEEETENILIGQLYVK